MYRTHHGRAVWWSGWCCVGALFVACGGLDGRKVTRGPDEAVAGEPSSTEGGSSSSAGGGESVGGEPTVNPFGGDFGGGAPPVLDGPPAVVEVSPADMADDAEPNGDVSLLFSEALDEATVTSDSIQITDGGVPIDGKLSYSGVIAKFEPAERLSLLAAYDVSVSQDVTDVGGQALESAFGSTFTVRDGKWAPQTQTFEQQDLWGGEHDIAMDARGNALVVFTRADGAAATGRSVFARWFRVGSGWQPEVPLEDTPEHCFFARVAVSPEGDAIVAWYRIDDANNHRVFARRFVNGEWEAAARDVGNLSQDLFNTEQGPPAVAIGGGQVMVAYFNVDYVASPFRQNYALMETATTLDGDWPDYPSSMYYTYYASGHYEDLRSLSLAVDTKGNGIAIFGYKAVLADAEGIYYSRKAANAPWQYAVKIPSSTLGDGGPVITSDGDGAMATWSSYNSTTGYSLFASRYTKAKQFAAPVTISDPDLQGWIALGGGRNLASDGKSFLAAWTQQVGAGVNAYVNRFDIETGKWDTLPTVVSDGTAVVGNTAAVGLDAHGNAIAAFDQQGTSGYKLMYARFVAASAEWGEPLELSEDGANYNTPLLTVAGNGVAGVLFRGGGRDQTGGGPSVGGLFRIFR